MEEYNFKRWYPTFSLVNKIFRENDIDHVFIKMLLDPFHMRDVDVIIPKLDDEKRAIDLLRKAGFRPYRAGKLLNPWKIICEGIDIGHLAVDLHPTAEWNRTMVADGREINSHRIEVKIGDTKAFLPIPEYSLYLVATHSFYQHMTILRPEVQNGIHFISQPKFSWKRLQAIARVYGTVESIYAFLLAINVEKPKTIDEMTLGLFSGGTPSALVQRWFDETEKKFPLIIPRWLGCIFPSYYHTKSLIGKVRPTEVAFDFISHYMRLSSGRGAFV